MENLGIQPASFIFQLLNFGIVVLILNKYLFKPVQAMLQKRQKKITQSLEDAQKIEARLEKVEKEVKAKLDAAVKESSKIIAEAKKSAQALADQQMKETAARIEKTMEKSDQRLAQKEAQLLSNVESQMATLAKAATEKVLSQYLSEAERQKITEQAIKQLSKNLN